MQRRLGLTSSRFCRAAYSSSAAPPQSAGRPGLAAEVDGLLARVCLTLHLRPQKSGKLHIVLLKDGREVHQRYLALDPWAQNPPIFGHLKLEGFYEPRSRTIFLSLADLREGILAHEMTHYVLCEQPGGPPPADLQEEWAQYVESSLD
jgi:hypothetical protein